MTMTNLDNELETMIDRHGARTILERIAYIAGEKAVHLETNWQDPVAARQWSRLMSKVNDVVDWSAKCFHA